MVCRDPILEENKNYWTDRAPGYSEVNRLELATAQRQRWKDCIREELTRRFPDRPLADLQVLEPQSDLESAAPRSGVCRVDAGAEEGRRAAEF